MNTNSYIFFLIILLHSNTIEIFGMERAPERNSSVDISKSRESTTQHTIKETPQHAIAEHESHASKPQTTESSRDSVSGTASSQAIAVDNSGVHATQSFKIDGTTIQEEPIQAIRINDAYDPKNLQSVDTGQQASTDLFTSKENFSTKLTDYNARRTGQADPMKSGEALIKMNEAFTKITEGDAIDSMSDVQILKLTEYKEKLDLLQKQWMVDPTQVKSADLAQFLNNFKDFSTEQMKQYTEKSLDRSSWQKVVDAIQDFFDVAFGYDKQATVVAEPIKEELLPSQIKDNTTRQSLFS